MEPGTDGKFPHLQLQKISSPRYWALRELRNRLQVFQEKLPERHMRLKYGGATRRTPEL